jgi:hypothetical protein
LTTQTATTGTIHPQRVTAFNRNGVRFQPERVSVIAGMRTTTTAPSPPATGTHVLGESKEVLLPDSEAYIHVTIDRLIDPGRAVASSYSSFPPDPGTRYMGVIVTVSPGSGADDSWVSVYGSDGQEYSEGIMAEAQAIPPLVGCADLTDERDSSHGGPLTGCVTFELPVHVKVAQVQYYDVIWNVRPGLLLH